MGIFRKYILENKILVSILVVSIFYLVFLLRNVVIVIFISYVVMAAVWPTRVWLQKRGFSRFLASIVPILVVIILMVLFVLPILIPVSQQFGELISNLPNIIRQINQFLPVNLVSEDIVRNIVGQLRGAGSGLLSLTGTVFETFFLFLLLIFVSFYLLYDREKIKSFILNFVLGSKDKIDKIESRVVDSLGKWVRGQLLLSFIVGILFWLAYMIIGLPFALSLAVLAGFLEIIPTLGPLLATVAALIVSLTVSIESVLYVLLAFVVIQTVENYFLTPKVLEKAVGLHPLVIVLGIVIGSRLFGVIGALLAVPLMLVVKEIIVLTKRQ